MLDLLHWEPHHIQDGASGLLTMRETLWMEVIDYKLIYLSWDCKGVTAKSDTLGCVKLYELLGIKKVSGKGQGSLRSIFSC